MSLRKKKMQWRRPRFKHYGRKTRTGRSQNEVRPIFNSCVPRAQTMRTDFTKQYNRVRQHVAIRTGAAQGVASSVNRNATMASLPAVNRPKQTATKANGSASTAHAKEKTADQLQALSKYTSRIRNIDMPYDLGVGVNRKGPSATANIKDKSDRATNEQVLDPRTRIILFKMIGRGLLYEVNGCVSTGKEVCRLISLPSYASLNIYCSIFHCRRRTCTMPLLLIGSTLR